MGRRGPRKEPTKLRLLKGNSSRRPVNANEPQPPVSPDVPAPFDWLEPLAKQQWAEVAPELHRLGLLTRVDLTFFAAYCQCFARWRSCEEWLSEHGASVVLRDKSGKVCRIMRAPQALSSREALAAMDKFGGQFGLSPSSRPGIAGAEPPKPENKFTRLGLVPDPGA